MGAFTYSTFSFTPTQNRIAPNSKIHQDLLQLFDECLKARLRRGEGRGADGRTAELCPAAAAWRALRLHAFMHGSERREDGSLRLLQ